MSKPAATVLTLPSDARFTFAGSKRVRLIERDVDGESVYEHFVVPSTTREVIANERYASGTQSVQASAQNGTSSGFLWLQNPASDSLYDSDLGLERIEFVANITSASAMLTLPRIVLRRFTHASPAGDVGFAGVLTTPAAFTSLALDGGIAMAFCPPIGQGSGTSGVPISRQIWEAREERDQIIIKPGEGVVVYQPDNGTAADSRRFVMNIAWETFAR